MMYMVDEPKRLHSIEDVEEFYEAIDRGSLTRKISEERPYVYFTMELYDRGHGIAGGGGLGVLAADTRRVAESLAVPFTVITPFYPWEPHQEIVDGKQREWHEEADWEMHGFERVGETWIQTTTGGVRLDVVQKQLGSTRMLCVTEPDFGELYSGESGSDHRLYQEVALGFGGYQALKLAGLKPAIIQLNEVATFFAAVARLDELVDAGMDFYEAVVYVRKHTLYTNHTLVQAAEAEFTYKQFEQYVFPNLHSAALKRWLADKFRDGRIRLSDATIEIAELKNAVSKLHARVANYVDLNGERVKFRAITNGIDLKTWVLPEILDFYHEQLIVDKFGLPTEYSAAKLAQVTEAQVRALKQIGRQRMNTFFSMRRDQYGQAFTVPEEALVYQFKRRFVSYKRPWLPFSDVARLKRILVDNNAYYLFAGKVHAGDQEMYGRLLELLELIDSDEVLRERVKYISDYDEQVAKALSWGGNVTVNVPVVGLEACGTSFMKDIGNLGVLISTPDGGVADATPDNYLAVLGRTEVEETENLYAQMESAARIWRDGAALEEALQRQLGAYLETIAGARMFRDYLNYVF
jgi:starch phosphorylase